MQLTDEEWKAKLTPEQYHILREKGTEAPFTGKFYKNSKDGMYKCVACGVELFSTKDQYETNTPGLVGWPSFNNVVNSKSIKLVDDKSLGMNRVEVVCANCGGHLGHLFDDEEASTNQHFCINSCALDFKES